MVKLAAIFSHPIQYFAPLLRELAARPEVDLTVYFCGQRGTVPVLDPDFMQDVVWDVPLLEGYRHRFLPVLFGVSRDDCVLFFYTLHSRQRIFPFATLRNWSLSEMRS